jgi:hypothetical protein
LSKSRLRARLERLERSVSTAVADPFGFNIDPTLAKSLRDDCDCVFGLGYDLDTKKAKSADERADIMKERESNSASISERARTITCPVGYGPVQAREDSRRADRSEATERSRRAYQSSILFSPRPTRKPQAVASTNFSAEHSHAISRRNAFPRPGRRADWRPLIQRLPICKQTPISHRR